MNLPADTTDAFERLLAQRYRDMTPAERLEILVSMNETARQIIRSSLPPDLSGEALRLAVARRLYNTELPEAALLAHARYPEP